MYENLRLAFRGIWTHKLRSFLTMLGIIIGIAAIIAIVSTIEGTNQQIKENLIGSGSNTVDVQLYQEEWTYEIEYNGIPYGVPQVTDDVLEQICAISTVDKASRYVSRNVYDGVYYQNTGMSGGYVKGIDLSYLDTCGYIMQKGRAFTQKDYDEFNKVCVVDEQFVEAVLSNADPIGKIVEIKKEPFTIVGVVTSTNKFEPTINTLEDYYMYSGEQSSGTVYIPITDWPICYIYDEPESIVIRATNTDDMTDAGKQAADILNGRLFVTDDSIKYKASDLLEQAQQLQQLSASTNNMLIWIAAISLLVGGIGVMNIMLVSVTERTGEIGLKKAIGARKTKIMAQFLTEAAVLTTLGGILGVIVGVVLANIISFVAGTPVAISVPASVFAVVFSMAIGIVFGILPSNQAANLNPIDALRHE